MDENVDAGWLLGCHKEWRKTFIAFDHVFDHPVGVKSWIKATCGSERDEVGL